MLLLLAVLLLLALVLKALGGKTVGLKGVTGEPATVITLPESGYSLLTRLNPVSATRMLGGVVEASQASPEGVEKVAGMAW